MTERTTLDLRLREANTRHEGGFHDFDDLRVGGVPVTSGGVASGVLASGSFNAAGDELTLVLDTGVKVAVPVPAVLRSAAAAAGNAAIDARVATWARANSPTGEIPEGSIPAAIMRDTEFTADTVRTLLGLTAQEVDDFLVGGSIAGNVITLTQQDGSTVQLTVPPDTDTHDGVIASGKFSAAVDELVLTLADSSVITIQVPAFLRGQGKQTADQVKQLIADALAAAVSNNTETGITVTYNTADRTIDFVAAGGAPAVSAQELIYFGIIETILEAATVDVSTLASVDASVAGHNISIGPSTNGHYFVILVPADHLILALVNTGLNTDVLSTYAQADNVRQLGNPAEQYHAYTFGPLNPGLTVNYRITLTE